MDIDITRFVLDLDPYEFSASFAEIGPNAARITWGNAKEQAKDSPLLESEEELQALRDHVQGMGFGEEVQQYGAEECNALFIQLISGDMRESGMDGDMESFDWEEYHEQCEAGQLAGRIGQWDDGRIGYYLGD